MRLNLHPQVGQARLKEQGSGGEILLTINSSSKKKAGSIPEDCGGVCKTLNASQERKVERLKGRRIPLVQSR